MHALLLLLILQDRPAPDPSALFRRFIYQPASAERGDYTLPEGAEDAAITTEDGVELHGWYRAAPEGRPTVLVFHGNGGNVTYFRGIVEALAELNAGYLAIDYRGFGRSGGSPTEDGLYEDAEASLRWLVERGAERIHVLGYSLGTGVAVELATREHVEGVVLQSPFTSIPALVEGTLGEGIASRIPDRFDSLSKIASLDEPVLILHGPRDRVVPFEHGQALFDAAPEPRTFVELPNSGHDDFLGRDRETWMEAVGSFLNRP